MNNGMDPGSQAKRDQNGAVKSWEGRGSGSESGGRGRGCCKCSSRCWRDSLRSNMFLILMAIGIAVGVGLGMGLRIYHPWFGQNPRYVMYLAFPGDLLLRMLKMCIIPLVVTSLIYGMASLPSKSAGKLGGYAVLYYMITTFMAVLLGLLLVATIQPGYKKWDQSVKRDKGRLVEPVDALLDLVRNLFPDNVIGACMSRTVTTYTYTETPTWSWKNYTENETAPFNESLGVHPYRYNSTGVQELITGFKVNSTSGTNVLGLVLFSIVLGLMIGKLGPRGVPFLRTIDGLQEGIISIVRLIIWYTPIGIVFILSSKIVGMDDPEKDFTALGWYMATVIMGLGIHGFVVLPVIYFIFVRANPFALMVNAGDALLTALSTASSSATMPITLECLEEKAKIDRRVTRFVIPVGATINMDGTALYEAVASIFIAQSLGMELNAGQYVTVSITATAAAIGAAGIPEAGLVTMMIVLIALGLPVEEIGLIYAVDWFLDRLRTSINVWGDSVGAGIVAKLSEKRLAKMDAAGETGLFNPAFAYDPTAYVDTHL